ASGVPFTPQPSPPPSTQAAIIEESPQLSPPAEVPAFLQGRAPMQPAVDQPHFQLSRHRLTVSLKNNSMEFWAHVSSARGEEDIHLKGHLEEREGRYASFLSPVDEQVAADKRMLVSASCFLKSGNENLSCDSIALDLYYEVDGVVLPAMRLE